MALRRIVAATAVIGVATAAGALAVVRPWSGPPRCTSGDLRIDTAGINVFDGPAKVDSVFLNVKSRERCSLAGPLRLQARDGSGSWVDVPDDPEPARALGSAPIGDVGSQTSATVQLRPRTPYLVYVVWERQLPPCAPAQMRVAGPRLVVPIQTLPQWCGQPVSLSNTFQGGRLRFG